MRIDRPKKRGILVVLLAALVFLPLAFRALATTSDEDIKFASEVSSESPVESINQATLSMLVPDQERVASHLLVGFSVAATPDRVRAAAELIGANEAKEVGSSGRLVKVELPPGQSVQASIEILMSQPGIDLVEAISDDQKTQLPKHVEEDLDSHRIGADAKGKRSLNAENPSNPMVAAYRTHDYKESFESGLSAEWVVVAGADAGWSIDSDRASDGNFSLKSDSIDDQQIAAIEFTHDFVAGELSYDVNVSAQLCCDLLRVYVNGALVDTFSDGPWRRVAMQIPDGTTTIRWEYSKSEHHSTGEDRVWIDNLEFYVPHAYASSLDHVLAVSENRLWEFDQDGLLVRRPIDIPMAVEARDLVVTRDRKIAIIDAPILHLYDPVTGEFTRTTVDGWNMQGNGSYSPLVSVGNYILSGNLRNSLGILRFDQNGQYINTVLQGNPYVDLTVGLDGNLYGLVNFGGEIDRISTQNFSVLETIQLNRESRGIAVDEAGFIFSATWNGEIEKFDAAGNLLQSETAPDLYNLHDIDISVSGSLFFGSRLSDVGVAPPDLVPLTSFPVYWSGPFDSFRGSFVAAVARSGPDGDADGMPDWWEIVKGFNPGSAGDAQLDSDQDGLNNLGEFLANTDPHERDTDQDGLSDGDEVLVHGSDPRNVDTDGDTLTDHEEVVIYGTDPTDSDSDGDGLSDSEEVVDFGTNPLASDTDGDGIDDFWEIGEGLDPNSAADAALDPDSDGLSNLEEYVAGSDRLLADTDLDGLLDGDEVHIHSTSPIDDDSDDDLMHDGWEVQYLFDPLSDVEATGDPDLDGYSNLSEFYEDTDPRDENSKPVARPWLTFQGGPQHTGYTPVRVDPSSFVELWSKDLYLGDLLRQPSNIDDTAFVVTSNSFAQQLLAINSDSGDILWSQPLGQAQDATGAAVDNGNVYAQTIDSSNNTMWAFDALTGQFLFQTPYLSTESEARTATPHSGNLYGHGGFDGGLTNFSGTSSTTHWSAPIGLLPGTTPAVDATQVYVYTEEGLKILDRNSGDILNVIADPGFRRSSHLVNSSPVIDRFGNVLVQNYGRLVSFDVKRNEISWIRDDLDAINQPVISTGVVYTFSQGDLVALDQRDGTEKWRVETPIPVGRSIVVTANYVFASVASEATYAINIETQEIEWTYPLGGGLSITEQGVLFIVAGSGQLVAIRIFGDADGDGMPDHWELRYGFDPGDANDGELDFDGDGLSNADEYRASTDPTVADSDFDGLSDGDEVHLHNTNPRSSDSDGDGLSDSEELQNYQTDPNAEDSDADGLDDYAEVQVHLTNPNSPDTDADGFTDLAEVSLGADPNDDQSFPEIQTLQIESFESGVFPAPGWLVPADADAGWVITTGDVADGTRQLQSVDVELEQSSVVEYIANFPNSKVSFEYKVFGGGCCDDFRFFVDGVEHIVSEHTHGRWVRFDIALPEGFHRLRWSYERGNWDSGDPVAAYLDMVRFMPDTDFDGIPDYWELDFGLSPSDPSDATLDSDGDTLSNLTEFELDTSPLNIDTDGDGMRDDWEAIYHLDPINPSDGIEDPDNDGLDNAEEYAYGTQPFDTDSDNDGGDDGWEVSYGFDPANYSDGLLDADNDGLVNGDEFDAGTSPFDPDSDADQLPDGWEVDFHLNPLDPTDADQDFDADGLDNLAEYAASTYPLNPDTDKDNMPDGWEVDNSLEPTDRADGDLDADGDGLKNLGEYQAGTNPQESDSDGDGMPDGWEVSNSLNPLFDDSAADPDGDGIANLQEYAAGSDPNVDQPPPPPPTPPRSSGGGGGGSTGLLLLLALIATNMAGRRLSDRSPPRYN